ncbi:hypothetical protein ACIO3O_08235 [Streptomyces sp. NPDC087440]|uniref:hypothetical protein n=1 Tax=Streptomyces sp. NPDC087440 TaxID=3365790 RepID=UPI0037FAB002
MSVRDKPCTQDHRLQVVFSAPVVELYERAVGTDAPVALARALELRSFLALAEEHVDGIRARIHQAMEPERDMDELDADDLRMDARWLEAALGARDSCRTALDDLLRTMPKQGEQVRLAPPPRQTITVTPAPVRTEPEPQRAGISRTRRP